MPWSAAQHKTFEALSHGWDPKDKKLASLKGLGHDKLKEMAEEGVSRRAPIEPRKRKR